MTRNDPAPGRKQAVNAAASAAIAAAVAAQKAAGYPPLSESQVSTIARIFDAAERRITASRRSA